MGSMGQIQTSGPGTYAQVGQIQTSGPGTDVWPAADWLAGHAGRLLLFAGKGGVGKSTCAAAAAISLSSSRDVLLCSTDPAGSLADVLGTAAETPAARLRVLQIEPAAQFGQLRERYAAAVDTALERVGLSGSAALDRRVIEALWDLSPPGIDELAATAAMLSAARQHETVVVDSSPTGHFLRLLEMPDVALGWTRQLMRVFVKYGIAGAAGGAAEALLDLSRQLRGLRDALRDPDATSVVIVTLNEPMVRAETDRLATALNAAGVRIAGVLVNRADGRAPERTASRSAGGFADIRAPVMDPAPVGVDALRGFVDTWNIVS
jgi:arsenite-transporting ATPase